MAPKSDKKFSEVFDAFGRANQSTQNRRDDILRAALSAPTAGLPVNQIKGGIENTIGGIKAADNFANNNPQIQGLLDNEYLGLAAGLNPLTGAASMFGNLSRLARNFDEGNTSKKTTNLGDSRGKNNFADLRGSVTPVSMEPAASNLGEGASMDAAERFREGAGYPSGVVRPGDYPTIGIDLRTGGSSPSTDLGARLDPNATEQYASNFKAGQANMDQIQDMYSGETKYKDTGKTALQLWAKANPALAQKEFAKAETRALKPGGELYGYDTMDTFKPIDIPEADRQNPIDQATALGGNLTIDAQTFADKKIEDTMAQIRNEEMTDMSLSDTLNLDIPSKLFLSDEDKERLNTGFDSNSLPLTGLDPSSFFDMKGSFPQPDIAPSLYGSFATVDRPYLMK